MKKETKTQPLVYCTTSRYSHFSPGINRYGVAANTASFIYISIYNFSKGCSREDIDQYEFIFPGNGKYLKCSNQVP